MSKNWACLPENVPCWAFRGPLALHLRLLAIVIIPNLLKMFNENRTILINILLDTDCWIGAILLASRRGR